MTRPPADVSRVLAAAVALAVALVSPAVCLAAAESSAAHHACCDGMKEDCGSDAMAVQKDCCAVDGADVGLLASAGAPSPTLVATVVDQPLPPGPSPIATPGPRVSQYSSRPTYLLVLALRL